MFNYDSAVSLNVLLLITVTTCASVPVDNRKHAEVPNKPVIFDESGKILSNIAGPYREGSDFSLICVVTGGYPAPTIQWRRGDSILFTSLDGDDDDGSGTRSLTLRIVNATRAHLLVVYTCTADNGLLDFPRKSVIKIELYLKPLAVEILSPLTVQPVRMGKKTKLWCRTSGSRPPATITWWLGDKEMTTKTKSLETAGVYQSESRMAWIPLKEYNKENLTCMAEHLYFKDFFIETKVLLDVYYKPEATIQLGGHLLISNIFKEGDDIFFICKIDANPPAYKVIWQHNGNQLQSTSNNRVVMAGNKYLALRNVSKDEAGEYTCAALNTEGDSKSQSLQINIIYSPICQNKEEKIIRAAVRKPIEIECEVNAYPPVDTVEWFLNNSSGLTKTITNLTNGKPVLKYTPGNLDFDYGVLSCKATNMAGKQSKPCMYTLLPLTRPKPLVNCIHNMTMNSLQLQCVPGNDGGESNLYVAQLRVDSELVANVSSNVPTWTFRNLHINKQIRFKVFATNSMGQSKPYIKSEEITSNQPFIKKAKPMLISVFTLLATALTVIILRTIVLAFERKRHKINRTVPVKTVPESEGTQSMQLAEMPARPTAAHKNSQLGDIYGATKPQSQIVTTVGRLHPTQEETYI